MLSTLSFFFRFSKVHPFLLNFFVPNSSSPLQKKQRVPRVLILPPPLPLLLRASSLSSSHPKLTSRLLPLPSLSGLCGGEPVSSNAFRRAPTAKKDAGRKGEKELRERERGREWAKGEKALEEREERERKQEYEIARKQKRAPKEEKESFFFFFFPNWLQA